MSAAVRRLVAWAWATHLPLIAFAAALPLWLHRGYIQLQGELPWDDAPGHLTLLLRWDALVFQDGPMVRDPFPPALYLLSAACMRMLGAWLPIAVWGVVLFASALSVGACLLGLRLGGRAGGVLLPLLAAAAPALATYSRVYVLDLPATAAVVWVVLCAWHCDGFRRPLATFGFGVALALAVLTKYSILAWVVPFVVAPAVLMLVRAPIAAMPLAVAAVPLAWVALAVRERFLPGAGLPLTARADILALEGWCLGGALALGGVRLVAGSALAGWRRGLRPGVYLGLTTLVFAAIVVPWLWVAGPEIATKVVFDLGKERQSSAFNWWAALLDLRMAWPATDVWLSVAAVAAAVEALLRVARLGTRPWVERFFAVDLTRAPALLFVTLVVASALIGTHVTATTLSTNTRYYLPLHCFAAAAVVAGLCRLRPTRWMLVPLLSALCVAQIAGSAELLNLRSSPLGAFRLDDATPRVGAAGRLTFYLPRAPDASGLRPALERSFSSLRHLLQIRSSSWKHHGQRCGSVAWIAPGEIEARRITALGELHGLAPCLWVPMAAEATLAEPAPGAVVFLGVPPATITRALPQLVSAGGEPWRERFVEALPDGSVLAIYAP
ncbi:hypothetical protein LBMAG42_29580 [Deltaproteobacteria bacterium]|nr:hypothetical protein LBMAG42_29580 [Deltaproteobacteria bacterium]